MPQNYWSLCNKRVEHICRAFNITAELSKGSKVNGISYTVSFWYGSRSLYELRASTAESLLEQIVAFDYGMSSHIIIHNDRTKGE